jgi:N-acetylglutamate synthase-like GNAT family acetyltransferase
MQATHTSYNIRRSYPDESKRIAKFLPLTNRQFTKSISSVLTCGQPERIVGVAALNFEQSLDEEHPAILLRFKILPRHAGEGRMQALMDAVLKIADDSNQNLINLEIHPSSPQLDFYKNNGFVFTKTEQLWNLQLSIVMQRLDRLSSRMQIPDNWVLRSPEENDLPHLKDLVTAYEFREAKDIFFNTPKMLPAMGYSRPHCSVVEVEGIIIAVLLVKGGAQTRGYVDIRLVAPEFRYESRRLNWILLHRTVRLSLESGYIDTLLTVNLQRDTETLNLCKRMDGQLVSEKALWIRKTNPNILGKRDP